MTLNFLEFFIIKDWCEKLTKSANTYTYGKVLDG